MENHDPVFENVLIPPHGFTEVLIDEGKKGIIIHSCIRPETKETHKMIMVQFTNPERNKNEFGKISKFNQRYELRALRKSSDLSVLLFINNNHYNMLVTYRFLD